MLKGPWKKGQPGIEDCIIDDEGYVVCERVGDEMVQEIMLLLPELVQIALGQRAGGGKKFDTVERLRELMGEQS